MHSLRGWTLLVQYGFIVGLVLETSVMVKRQLCLQYDLPVMLQISYSYYLGGLQFEQIKYYL